VPYIFKASFDKANRTSLDAFRGPGIDEGLRVLADVRAAAGVPVLTDVHDVAQVARVATVVDVLQIPAFLCRQTDLLVAAAASGKPVNVKKGQFLAPEDMRFVVAKLRQSGATEVTVTERGTTFGYKNLVVDMRGLLVLRREAPVVFDATHSVQRPGGGDGFTSGDRQLALPLARAAVAVGVDGIFCEVHPDPDRALSDGPNSLTFALLDQLLGEVCALPPRRRSD
jgi:2-dehydro-3-deoxyphosphooctonate aldolase (KDO 8-P synthase)